MNLLRSFARSEKDVKIKNSRKYHSFKGQWSELNITGALKKKNRIISGRDRT